MYLYRGTHGLCFILCACVCVCPCVYICFRYVCVYWQQLVFVFLLCIMCTVKLTTPSESIEPDRLFYLILKHFYSHHLWK